MTARVKVLAGFGIVLVVLAMVGWQGVAGMRRATYAFEQANSNQLEPLVRLTQGYQRRLRIRIGLTEHILTQNAARKQAIEDRIELDKAAAVEHVRWLLESAATASERGQFEAMEQRIAPTAKVRLRLYELSREGRQQEAAELFETQYLPPLMEVDKEMEAINEAYYQRVQEALPATRAEYSRIATQIMWVVGFGLAAGAVILFMVYWLMVRLKAAVDSVMLSAQTLAASAAELNAVSSQVSDNTEQTSTQAAVASAASEQVSKNIEVVATSSEEMSASISEIAKNSSDAARIAKQAVGVSHTMNQTIGRLGDSSTEIGNVIKLITSIAEQTNLLALNATIEAARAGESGKGFAVVANEVKELAKDTAKATEGISLKIQTIQEDTKGAVVAIDEVGTIINQISEISTTIASAVEEQTATTNEITRNATEAARGSQEIAQSISSVATVSQSTSQGVNDTRAAAKSLAEMADRIEELVGQFNM
jgi:hypothetical protein